MKNKLNIFVVSNPTSAMHAAMIAEASGSETENFLILDRAAKKPSFLAEIKLAASGYTWSKVIDYSILLNENTDLKPSLRKRLSRKFRHLPVISSIYQSLLKNHKRKENEWMLSKLKTDLEKVVSSNQNPVLFVLAQTWINEALFQLFPNSKYYYFEHGLPDYLFSLKDHHSQKSGLYCVFNEEFEQFLKHHSELGLIECHGFTNAAIYESYYKNVYSSTESIIQLGKKLPEHTCLILLQPLEKYNLKADFWLMYVDKILKANSGNAMHLVIKPHPLQSEEIMRELEKGLKDRKVSFDFLVSPEEKSISCELIYALFNDRIDKVYSPFSYSIFFLAKIFRDNKNVFYHSYPSMYAYVARGPQQFVHQFTEHEAIIKECFSVYANELAI